MSTVVSPLKFKGFYYVSDIEQFNAHDVRFNTRGRDMVRPSPRKEWSQLLRAKSNDRKKIYHITILNWKRRSGQNKNMLGSHGRPESNEERRKKYHVSRTDQAHSKTSTIWSDVALRATAT